MIGLKKNKFQYFTAYGQKDLDRIAIDGYKIYSYEPQKELIRYKFDQKNCVRLDLLLKSADLFKIRGGQALEIMSNIITHCELIQQKGSTHTNLTTDKVWLIQQSQSISVFSQSKNDKADQINIIFSDNLDFEIHFTGYVDGDESINYDSTFICKQVLIEMLNSFYKFQNSKNDKKVDGNSLLTIQHSLLNKLQKEKCSMKEFKIEISKIMDKYKFSQKSQFLKGIDTEQYGFLGISPRIQNADSAAKSINKIENTYLVDKVQESVIDPVEQMLKQLDFDNYLYEVYKNKLLDELNNKLITNAPKIQEESQFSSQKSKIQEIGKQQLNQLLIDYQENVVDKLDSVLQNDFKFESLIKQKELQDLIYKKLEAHNLQMCNSIESFNQYTSKGYILPKHFHQHLKSEIIRIHRENFIKIIDQLIQELK